MDDLIYGAKASNYYEKEYKVMQTQVYYEDLMIGEAEKDVHT